MDKIVSIILVIVGIINIFPIIVFFDPTKTLRLYGLTVEGESLTVLMRHRGVLLAIIGVALIAAAVKPEYRVLGIALALISKLTFIFLTFTASDINSQIKQVAWIDVGAIALLLIVLAIHFWSE